MCCKFVIMCYTFKPLWKVLLTIYCSTSSNRSSMAGKRHLLVRGIGICCAWLHKLSEIGIGWGDSFMTIWYYVMILLLRDTIDLGHVSIVLMSVIVLHSCVLTCSPRQCSCIKVRITCGWDRSEETTCFLKVWKVCWVLLLSRYSICLTCNNSFGLREGFRDRSKLYYISVEGLLP